MSEIHMVKQALPERDQAVPVEQQGVFRKFDVRRVDGSDQPGGKHHGCEYFVLDVDHDPHAKASLAAYAQSCRLTHPDLSADMKSRYGLDEACDTPGQTVRCSPQGWVSFEERDPPADSALDEPTLFSPRSVLVTNNIKARNRMNQPSHVWWAMPYKEDDGTWVAFTDSSRKIEALTHWFDPLAAIQSSQGGE